jgi:hypothetical protein
LGKYNSSNYVDVVVAVDWQIELGVRVCTALQKISLTDRKFDEALGVVIVDESAYSISE